MTTKKILLSLFFIFNGLVAASNALFAAGKLNVVATTTSLADIAGEVAKDKIRVYAIASPKQDIHHYAPTPKDVLKVKKANVLIHEGLDLEAWREPLLDAAGNTRLMGQNQENSIDASRGISLLEVPASLSRSEGDIHAFGNPHYIAGPENAKVIALNISEGLSKADPEDAGYFKKNAEEFGRKMDEKIKEWKERLAPFQGAPVITYHRSWSYFTQTFGLAIAGEVEPKPGIPPTAKHLAELIQLIKEKKIQVIIREPFEESETPKKIADETGAHVVTLSQAVGEPKGAKDYLSMMDQNVQALEAALKGKGAGHG